MLFLFGFTSFAVAQTSQLVVGHFPVCDDSESTPYFGAEFEYKLGWVRFEQKTGERTPTPRRMLFETWLPGELYEDFPGSEDGTPPARDPWGRTFLEGEPDELSWHGTSRDGTLWELCLIVSDTLGNELNPHYPRYQLRRNGETVAEFTPAESTRPAIAAAWLQGDSCIVEYRFSTFKKENGVLAPIYHTTLLNGKNLNREYGLEQMSGLCNFGTKPYFLFQRDGKWGWSFDGEETVTDYDEFYFDQCCEPGMWNPYIEQNGFELIARRGTKWYLIVGTVHSE